MAFRHVKGPALQEFYPKTASTALTIGGAARMASGFLTSASATTTQVFGVLQKSVVSTDTDYASTTQIPVILPQADDEFEADLTGSTFTATNAGQNYDLDATGLFVDLTSTQTHNQVMVLRQGSSSTKAIVKFNGAYTFKNAA